MTRSSTAYHGNLRKTSFASSTTSDAAVFPGGNVVTDGCADPRRDAKVTTTAISGKLRSLLTCACERVRERSMQKQAAGRQ